MAPQTKYTKYLHERKPLLEKDDNKSFNLYKVYDLFGANALIIFLRDLA